MSVVASSPAKRKSVFVLVGGTGDLANAHAVAVLGHA